MQRLRLSGGSDFLYSVNLCGNYEFELVRIKLYDFSRLFYVTKRVKKYANVEVMPFSISSAYATGSL